MNTLALDDFGNHLFRGAINRVAGDFVTRVAQFGGGFFQIISGLVINVPCSQEVTAESFQQRTGERKINRLGHAGAAIVRDEKFFDALKRGRRDEHWSHSGTNDAFEICAQVFLGHIGARATFADDDEITTRFEFFEGFNQRAVALRGVDFSDATGGELMLRIFQDGFAFEPLHAALRLFELGQLLGQVRAGVHADAAAEVPGGGAFAVMIEHVEDFDAGGESLGGPSGVLIETRRVTLAIGAGENGWHDASMWF